MPYPLCARAQAVTWSLSEQILAFAGNTSTRSHACSLGLQAPRHTQRQRATEIENDRQTQKQIETGERHALAHAHSIARTRSLPHAHCLSLSLTQTTHVRMHSPHRRRALASAIEHVGIDLAGALGRKTTCDDSNIVFRSCFACHVRRLAPTAQRSHGRALLWRVSAVNACDKTLLKLCICVVLELAR